MAFVKSKAGLINPSIAGSGNPKVISCQTKEHKEYYENVKMIAERMKRMSSIKARRIIRESKKDNAIGWLCGTGNSKNTETLIKKLIYL